MKSKGKSDGFTIIELIAVISIVSILIAMISISIIVYAKKANAIKVKSNANIVLKATSLYNAEHDGEGFHFEDVTVIQEDTVKTKFNNYIDPENFPKEFIGKTIEEVKQANDTGTIP